MIKVINIMSYDVMNDTLDKLKIRECKQTIVNTINPHSYITAKDDKQFEEALRDSNFLIPDGSGMVLAAKYINNKNIKKISGSDLHIHLLKELNNMHGKLFYMGASKETLVKLTTRLSTEYPNVLVNSYSPPFKPTFTKEENEIIISKINNFNPDVLFIGMTAPKQEKWLYQHKDLLSFKVASSIGAVFDFYAGTVERPSQFWLDLHLEWLGRLVKEPKRMWRRNFVSTPLFLLDVILYKFGFRK